MERVSPRKKTLKVDNDENENNLSDVERNDSAKSSPVKTDDSKFKHDISDSEEEEVPEMKSSDIESKVRQEVSDSEEESPVDAMEKKTYQPMNVEKQDGTSDGIKFLSL